MISQCGQSQENDWIQSEEHFRALIENLLDVVVVVDSRFILKYLSPSVERILGYKPDEKIGSSFFSLIHAEDLPLIQKTHETLLSSATSTFPRQYRMQHKDGSWRVIETVNTNLLSDPRIQGILINLRDITDRSRMKNLQRETLNQINGILEVALDCIISIDRQGRIIEFNPAAERTFGYTKKDVLGQEMADLIIPPAYRERHRMGFARHLATGEATMLGKRIEINAIRSDQTEFPCELTITKINIENGPIFTAYLRDITQHKQAEQEIYNLNQNLEQRVRERTAQLTEANKNLAKEITIRKEIEAKLRSSQEQLRQSEERFSKAFKASPAMVTITHLDSGRFLEVNESFLRTCGFTSQEVIGKTASELNLSTDDENYKQMLSYIRKHGLVRSVEWYMRTKNQGVRVILYSAELIKINHIPFAIGVGIDITERKKAEKKLLNALSKERELNQLKSSFVSMVSHEYRTPLGIILSSAEILEQYFERLSLEERFRHLKSIRECIHRMTDLMEEGLLLGQAEAGKMKFSPAEFDLNAFCKHTIQEIISTFKRNPIQFVGADIDRPAYGDTKLLHHILVNLLSNAIKYSTPQKPIHFSIKIDGEQAIFEIEDSGIGIPINDQTRLFTAFQRGGNVGNVSGSGLGLVIVKRCIELHHGNISIRSTEGQGTRVTVKLPLFPTKSKPQNQSTQSNRII